MKQLLLLFLCIISQHANAQYQLVWSDEFSGNDLDLTKWTFDIGGSGWGNSEPQYYTNNNTNIDVDTGYLRITAINEQFGGSDYTSARIKTEALYDFKYGKVEARIKLPVGQGLWPAFWMLGSNISVVSWPQCGEIDIMEHINNSLYIHGTYHFNNGGHVYYGDDAFCDVTEFHTYGIEWDENSIKWFLDGNEFYSANITNGIGSTEEFHHPFFLILNMATGGNWPGYPDPNTVFPAHMFVDYVRVYQQAVDIEETSNNDISIFPNPTADLLNVKNILPLNRYHINNLSGILIDQGIIDQNGQIDVRDLEAGTYIIEIGTPEEGILKRSRFVKSN